MSIYLSFILKHQGSVSKTDKLMMFADLQIQNRIFKSSVPMIP